MCDGDFSFSLLSIFCQSGGVELCGLSMDGGRERRKEGSLEGKSKKKEKKSTARKEIDNQKEGKSGQ